MENLLMCRVCLEVDIRLLSIVGTHLQEMYESLVLMPVESTGRPIHVCYICRARLQNCYELRKSCLRSEQLFTQMLSCNEYERVQLQAINCKKRLTMHNAVHLGIDHVLEMDADNDGVMALKCEVKVEPYDREDIENDVLEESSVSANVQSADSDDDFLITLKEERIEHRTSDSISKEPTQAVQRSSEELTTCNLNEHGLVQDTFKKLHEVNAAGVTDDNKERTTSVPRSEGVQYTCDTCQQCYSNKRELDRHVCLCSDVWKKDLSRENNTHARTTQKLHHCSKYKKQLSSTYVFTRHLRTHTGEKPYHCDLCKKQFTQKCHLTTHKRTHTGEKPYHCDICKKQFSRKSSLTTHMVTHTGEKPYHCDICEKRFARKDHYTKHIMRAHTGEKPHHCEICEKKFLTTSQVTAHMRTHTDEKPYHCDICKKQFSHKSHLIPHMRTHTDEKPYHCHICKKQFSLKCNLNRHMRRHAGDKPYHCGICKKPFLDKSNFSRHMRAHTGEKPYHCDICKKQYSVKRNLTSHMRTHTDENPYHCYICKKQFVTTSNLTTHMSTHSDEKPYH